MNSPLPDKRGGIINEIVDDTGLQACGLLLSMATTLPWFWNQYHIYTLEPIAICQPSFMNLCQEWRTVLISNTNFIKVLSFSSLLLSLLASFLFLFSIKTSIDHHRWARWFVRGAWWSLLLAHVVRVFFEVQDFRLRHNANYMLFACVLVFLFSPSGKRDAMVMVYAFCYFWAGTLKFNNDWIDGRADWFRLAFPICPEDLIAPLHYYVIVLELIGSFGLMMGNMWVFWSTWLQFFTFHVVSYFIVGWFYPSVCVPLLALFVVCRWVPQYLEVSTISTETLDLHPTKPQTKAPSRQTQKGTSAKEKKTLPKTTTTTTPETTTIPRGNTNPETTTTTTRGNTNPETTTTMARGITNPRRIVITTRTTIKEEASLFIRFFTGQMTTSVYLVVLLLCICNTIPKLLPGDIALTGECRQLGLHMIDADVHCQTTILVSQNDGNLSSFEVSENHLQLMFLRRLQARHRCHPTIPVTYTKNLCEQWRMDQREFAKVTPPENMKIDSITGYPFLFLNHQAKRSSDSNFTQLLDLEDLCHTSYNYKFCGVNEWIQPSRFKNLNDTHTGTSTLDQWLTKMWLEYGP